MKKAAATAPFLVVALFLLWTQAGTAASVSGDAELAPLQSSAITSTRDSDIDGPLALAELDAELVVKKDHGVEPVGVLELTERAVSCANGIGVLTGEDMLRLVFLLNTQMIVETRTIGQVAKKPFLQVATPFYAAATYFIGERETPAERLFKQQDMQLVFKSSKTMLRVLYQLTHTLVANVYAHDVLRNARDMTQPEPADAALRNYRSLLTDLRDVYTRLKGDEVRSAMVEGMRAGPQPHPNPNPNPNPNQNLNVAGLQGLPLLMNRIRTSLLGPHGDGQDGLLHAIKQRNPTQAEWKRVNCKAVSMVLRNANDRLTEHDAQNAFHTAIMVTTAKLVSSVVTSAAAVGGSCSPAGPAGGAIAGAVVGLVTSMGTSLLETSRKYSDNIRRFRREVRRVMISFLDAQVLSNVAYEKKNARELAVRRVRRQHKAQVRAARPHRRRRHAAPVGGAPAPVAPVGGAPAPVAPVGGAPAPVAPSAEDLRNNIRAAVKAAADFEPDCLDAAIEIYKDILSMLFSSHDAQLLELIKTCTTESEQEFNAKWRNKLSPSTFERLLPTFRLIAGAAGFNPDSLSSIEGPAIGEVIAEVLSEKLPELSEALIRKAETEERQAQVGEIIAAGHEADGGGDAAPGAT